MNAPPFPRTQSPTTSETTEGKPAFPWDFHGSGQAVSPGNAEEVERTHRAQAIARQRAKQNGVAGIPREHGTFSSDDHLPSITPPRVRTAESGSTGSPGDGLGGAPPPPPMFSSWEESPSPPVGVAGARPGRRPQRTRVEAQAPTFVADDRGGLEQMKSPPARPAQPTKNLEQWFQEQQNALQRDMGRLQAKMEGVRDAEREAAFAREARVAEDRQRRREEALRWEAQQAAEDARLEAELAQRAAAHKAKMAAEEEQRRRAEAEAKAAQANERAKQHADFRSQWHQQASGARPQAPEGPKPAQPAPGRSSFWPNFGNMMGGGAGAGGAPAAAGGKPSPPPAGEKQASPDADFQRRKAEAEARKKRSQDRYGAGGCGGGGSGGPSPQGAGPRAQAAPEAPRVNMSEWRAHEDAWSAFEAAPPAAISFTAVPWPPVPDQLLRALVALVPESDRGEGYEKKAYRKATLRWHPDKFLAKFGGNLVDHDKERVLAKVKDIAQVVNRAWDSKLF